MDYQQIYSVAEIVLKECSRLTEEEVDSNGRRLALTRLSHPFPYSLNVADSGSMAKVAMIAPRYNVISTTL